MDRRLQIDQKKNKHLTLEERGEIEQCLDRGMTFKAISWRIGKDQTTVSKEVKKHLNFTASKVVHRDKNGQEIPSPVCPKLLKTPFVCNPCEKKRYSCPFQKQKYIAKLAQQEYESLLIEAREGIALNKEEFHAADKVITEGIQKGQHLYHILQSNNLKMSKSAVYRNLQKGYLSVSAIDFPRVVKFKQRRHKPMEYIPKDARIGRTYVDFLTFIEENDISSWVEMDTVIGRIGGKVILTLYFTACNFMAGILLNNKSAAESAAKFRILKGEFNARGIPFGDVLPLILTDNGGEFANISAFMTDLNGEIETRLFFCDPMQSCQKPRVEKNHTLFRDIVPKGESFDAFTQETINLIFSHVNSVKRKSLNGKTPFELFSFIFGTKIAEIFDIFPVPAELVVQSPMLLKRY